MLAGEIHGGNYIREPVNLDVVGDYAYIASRYYKSMVIINISDPANPTYSGREYMSTSFISIEDVKVVGDYAFAAAFERFVSVDTSNKADPVWVSRFDPGNFHLVNIEISGNYAFIACDGFYDPFLVADISDPENVSLVTSVVTDDWQSSWYKREVLNGDYVYIVGRYPGDRSKLVIMDISNPEAPSVASKTSGAVNYLNQPSGIAVQGNYAYVASYSEIPILPTVTTEAMTNVKALTATGNGNVTDLGTSDPTQHGHCWSTSPSPTIADDKTELGPKTTTGAFTSSLTELTPRTLYYCRAYATSVAGTAYGSEETFTTRIRVLGNPNIDQRMFQHVERIER